MKKLWIIIDQLQVKYSTIIFLVVSFLLGQIKDILLYFIIAVIHELMHFLTCIYLNVKTKKIIILPFGACLEVENIDKISSFKQLLIYLMGPCSAIINLLWITLFNKIGLINSINFEKILLINFLMAILNLLPIFPLDGYMIVKAILQLIMPYKKALRYSLIVSVLFLFLFTIYNFYKFQPMVLFFLIIEQFKNIKQYKVLYKQFLIYKTLGKKHKKYKMIKNYDMFKDCNNYKLENKIILDDVKIASKELNKYIN